MKRFFLIAAALVPVALFATYQGVTAEEELDGFGIVNKVDKSNRAKDEKDFENMTLVDSKGQKRERTLVTFFKTGEGNDDLTLVRFDTPQNLRGTGLLALEKGADDDMWLYLPDLRKSKRIAGGTKSEPFVGTDFSNYDMRTEDLDGHNYKKVGDEKVGDRDCYVVEATPKTDAKAEETGYSKRTFYADKERWVYNKIVFYDRQGKHLKTTTIEDWKQYENLWRGDKVTVENVQKESKTIVIFPKRELNKGLGEDTFSKRTLENP
jgi:hypothetical protein